jgi:hypothetical protein
MSSIYRDRTSPRRAWPWTSIRSVLLRPAALPTGYYDPLSERSDLTEDDYHRLRHPSQLTAATRIATAIRGARLGWP